MTALRMALRMARDVGTTTRVGSARRERWGGLLRACAEGYWPELGRPLEIRLDRRVRQGGGGRMVRGRVTDGRVTREFWIKWCPDADPRALDECAAHMRIWRFMHPALCGPVADLLDLWPEARVLLIDGRAGRSLGRILADGRAGLDAGSQSAVTKLGSWWRAYAEGHGVYGVEVGPLLGDEAQRTMTGELRVNARRLLEQRLDLAERAAHDLVRRGYSAAGEWSKRREVDAVVASFGAEEPAGFIHGDLKPDNVLVEGDAFAVIDWWTTPRVSWPLQDPAMLAANLWMSDHGPVGESVWARFAEAYFDGGADDRAQATMDLLGAMTCLGFVADKTRTGSGRLLDRRWCAKVLDALGKRSSAIGAV